MFILTLTPPPAVFLFAGGNKYITAIAAIIFLYVYFNFTAAAGGNFYLPAVINILPPLPRLFSSMFILTLPPPPPAVLFLFAGGNKYITAIAAIIFLYVYFNFTAAAGGNFYLPAVINILPPLPRLFSSMFILTLTPPPAVVSICRR